MILAQWMTDVKVRTKAERVPRMNINGEHSEGIYSHLQLESNEGNERNK